MSGVQRHASMGDAVAYAMGSNLTAAAEYAELRARRAADRERDVRQAGGEQS